MARALHLIQELGCGEVTATEFDCSAGAPRKGKHFTARISAIILRMLSRANLADSNSSWVVSGLISLFRPPITPARATGFSPSQMTRFWGVRVNSLLSAW